MILGYFHKHRGSSLANFVQQWDQVKAQAVLGQDDTGGHWKQPCHGREGSITVVLGMQLGIWWYDEICRSSAQHIKQLTREKSGTSTGMTTTRPALRRGQEIMPDLYFQGCWRESSKGGGHAPAVCKVCWSFELTLAQGRTPWYHPLQLAHLERAFRIIEHMLHITHTQTHTHTHTHTHM